MERSDAGICLPHAATGDSLNSVESQAHRVSMPTVAVRQIAVASTFTANLMCRPMRFWMEKLDISAEVMAPSYARVVQEMLDPRSAFATNRSGFNIILVRLVDWIRDRMDARIESNLQHTRRSVEEFIDSVEAHRSQISVPILIFVAPSPSTLSSTYSRAFERLENEIQVRLGAMGNVHCWNHADLVRLYPIAEYEDVRADRIGHIPYSHEYFVALATLLSRRIAALTKPPFKVIAIDCDNTLWKGICGEDGAIGVELTPSHVALQQLLVRQHDAGVLLCLCSKNNPQDVDAVFQTRSDMLLKEEHLVSTRVNWDAKSSNLKSLASELNLSLDSFILLDDSQMECAEVSAHCPSVLTLLTPQTPEGMSHFIEHTWAFDRVGVTEEARHRSIQYRQNRQRTQALKATGDLQKFLASLELQVDVSQMHPDQLPRVAELIQRTNQFNLTGIRRNAGDIHAATKSGELDVLVVHVRDRFGDYGLVGAILFSRQSAAIDVDTFVLSCRVLGRGVEWRIVNELGRMAIQEGLSNVILRYRRSLRNDPARSFLRQSFARYGSIPEVEVSANAECVFSIPVEYAVREAQGIESETFLDTEVHAASTGGETRSTRTTQWHESAFRLSRIPDLMREIDGGATRTRIAAEKFVAPRTPAETTIAAIWSDILRCDAVSVHDDFFNLGGDSLLAVQVIARMELVLGLRLPIDVFFARSTVEEMAGVALATAAEGGLPITHSDHAGAIPLADAQQRLWFIDQLGKESAAYIIPVALRICGQLNRTSLQAALDTIIRRHAVLRTVITTLNDKPAQQVLPAASFSLQTIDLRSLPAQAQHAELARHTQEEVVEPFSLRSGPVIRGRLLQLGDEDHVLHISMHHIVSDGWSVGVFIRELVALYEAYRDNLPDPLPPLSIQYADYALWQRQNASELEQQLQYWKDHLRGAPEVLDLPMDRPRTANRTYRGSSVQLSLGTELSVELKEFAKRFNVTLAMTLYAAWSAVLARLSGQQDIVIGVPVANRRRSEFEGLIGFFVNTLAIRVHVDNDLPVLDLLARVKTSMLGAYAHQDVPFEQVVEAIQPVRSSRHNAVFQVMFVMQSAPRESFRFAGLSLTEQDVPSQTAKFDVTLTLQDSSDGLIGNINYSSDLFDAETISGWIRLLKAALLGIIREPMTQIGRLSLLGEAERRQVVQLFNNTEVLFPVDRLIQDLFEEQALRKASAWAVVHEGFSLTFDELNRKANQLARFLRGGGIGPGHLVGLCVRRSPELVVGILGILKAGGAYVPLDPDYPTDRLASILEDACPRIVLTHQEFIVRLQGVSRRLVSLDSDWSEISRQSSDNLDARSFGLNSRHPAYVIYTSGSTGMPKGVVIEHKNVMSLWQGLECIYRNLPCERIAVNASFNFDASVKQLIQLLSGRTIALVPQEVRLDATTLLNFVNEYRIDGIDCTPFQLRSWLAAGMLDRPGHKLRVVLVGGEPIDIETWRILSGVSDTEFYNVYGPTESTVDATFARITGDTTPPHIGVPMENRRIYVLDNQGSPVAIGMPGEIHIGGAGVARGYLNRPQLTAERFLPDVFSTNPEDRMYRTGDIARWRRTGALEYLGRNDNQVKVRGFRIELGEIEAQLIRHAGVRDAAVIACLNEGQQVLVAYLVPLESAGLTVESVRTYLKLALPGYMVPGAIVMIEHMPLTPNGKLDRKALPAPDSSAYVTHRYEEPLGETEQTIARIWQELVHVPRIGRNDNFFDLGGHSLLAMQVVARIRSVLHIDVPMKSLFEHPTVNGLADCVDEIRRTQLLRKLADGGEEIDELLSRLAEMPDKEVKELLKTLRTEERL